MIELVTVFLVHLKVKYALSRCRNGDER